VTGFIRNHYPFPVLNKAHKYKIPVPIFCLRHQVGFNFQAAGFATHQGLKRLFHSHGNILWRAGKAGLAGRGPSGTPIVLLAIFPAAVNLTVERFFDPGPLPG